MVTLATLAPGHLFKKIKYFCNVSLFFMPLQWHPPSPYLPRSYYYLGGVVYVCCPCFHTFTICLHGIVLDVFNLYRCIIVVLKCDEFLLDFFWGV